MWVNLIPLQCTLSLNAGSVNLVDVNPILPDLPDWHAQIGRFVLNFGFLDYKLFEFLDEQLKPEQFEKLRKQHFKDRLVAICEYLADKNPSPEKLAVYDQFAARAEEIRKFRNHIAHSYMFFRPSTTGYDPLTLILCNPKDIYNEDLPSTIRLSFADLQKTNADLCELIEQFQSLIEPPQS